jgi:hypothetical protein
VKRRAAILGLLLAGLTGCPSPPASEPSHPVGALGPSAPGGVVRLDVRHIEARPGLTLLVREGDPAPALVAAVATGLGPAATTALASIAEHRLHAAGYPVEAQIDGLGFRLVWAPADKARLQPMLAALVQALAAPVGRDRALATAVAQRLAALRRHPLDGPALEPVAQCSGTLGILATQALPDPATAEGVEQLERWRASGFGVDRMALAVVGPADLAEAVGQALERTSGWPTSHQAWPAPLDRDRYGVFASATLPARSAVLQLAFWVDDPHRAATAVARLGQTGSPLVAKLAASPRPWRLESMQATALPAGGCISLTLRPEEELPADDAGLARAAAKATALVRRELDAQLPSPPDPFVATSQIITAGDPRAAAARAAWWSLAGAGHGEPVREAVALGLSALGDAPAPDRLDGLERALRAARAAEPAKPLGAALAERRLAVERGQGEVWVLVASPCALLGEGPNEAGSAALATLATVLGAEALPDVQLEPWIGPDGVGLLAHGGLRGPAEQPSELARRVARAAGKAFANGVGELGAVLEAKRQLLRNLDDDASRAFEQFARAAAPNHPSTIAPLGLGEPLRAADRPLAVRAWRRIQRSPVRVAVLGNADLAQATLAAQEVDGWLLDEAAGGACGAAEPLAAPRAGSHATPASPDGLDELLVGMVTGTTAEDRRLGELTAAALGGPDGILAEAVGADRLASSWSAHFTGGKRAAALLVELSSPPGKAEAAQRRLREVLARLRTTGPSAHESERALAALERSAAPSRLDPKVRLGELWASDGTPRAAGAPSVERWRAWLRATLDESSLIVVATPPSERHP